jgi:hypothetical protein
LFSVSIITILLILNGIYFKYIINKRIEYKKEKAYQEYLFNNNKIDFAFLGDSHTAWGMNTDDINNSYNYAANGGSYYKLYYNSTHQYLNFFQ